ncbi:unnamed protein product [Arabidopsis arenosa]|uniref:Uncharacterized protein n=1 Tax=Arabidopsis arenosa TaxID=38785 RepID=A0A8S1ZJB7_ARAAE|nr:unnamed protein product [Arabidopsis arenosa]
MVNETVGQRLCAIVIPNESVDGKSSSSTCMIELCVPLCKTKYANGTGTCRIQVPQSKEVKHEPPRGLVVITFVLESCDDQIRFS